MDRAVIVVGILSAAYLASRALPMAGAPGLRVGILATALTVIAGVLVAALLVPRSRRWRWARRGAAYLVALLLAALALQRWNAWRLDARDWPVPPDGSLAGEVDRLTPGERARWAARVAAHLVSVPDHGIAVPAVPTGWPFPSGVALLVDSTDAGVEVWARTEEDTLACIALPRRLEPSRTVPACRGAPPSDGFVLPVRRERALRQAAGQPVATGWHQYRADASRRAQAGAPDGPLHPWRVATGGPVRSSVGIVGTSVLVGGHGTGTLTAVDLREGAVRWQVRLPNWLHQDPASDGVHVVVGFGDNGGSFGGRAPSGVAAYALDSGELLWTVFDEASVMTSVVLADSLIAYGTSAGTIRVRRLVDGALVAEEVLPGGVVMAPLARTGDTLVATLDINGACALLLPRLTRLWCRQLPHLRRLGHAAPAVADGRIVLTGQVTLLGLTVAEWRGLGRGLQRRMVTRALSRPGLYTEIAGQVVLALDLATGSTLWFGALQPYTTSVRGHVSGTPVLLDSLGVVVLPNADLVAAFDLHTGSLRWGGEAHRARGAPLVARGHVIVAGRDGVLTARDLHDGALRCSVQREVGWDRGGPALAGGYLVSVDLAGTVEAMPLADLLACRSAAPPEIVVSVARPFRP